jgi:16S rRNA (guanine966-N2)-methyltransferase
MMRIIAGRFKGIRIHSPKAKGLRPTSDLVRGALFDILGTEIQGSRVLDLFAGTGAFGFEALSRGAEYAVFVEKDYKAAQTIKAGIERLELGSSADVLISEANRAVHRMSRKGPRFEIVFIDPPYASGLAQTVLTDPEFVKILEAKALVIIEAGRDSKLILPDFLSLESRRIYGETVLEIAHLREKTPFEAPTRI